MHAAIAIAMAVFITMDAVDFRANAVPQNTRRIADEIPTIKLAIVVKTAPAGQETNEAMISSVPSAMAIEDPAITFLFVKNQTTFWSRNPEMMSVREKERIAARNIEGMGSPATFSKGWRLVAGKTIAVPKMVA